MIRRSLSYTLFPYTTLFRSIQGNHVEHWLNGEKVLEYELGSPEVKAAVAKSKFKNAAGFGEKIKGHILLTDHHGETWFRRSEEHTSELQSHSDIVCRLLLEK